MDPDSHAQTAASRVQAQVEEDLAEKQGPSILLSHAQVVPGSEMVILEVRDRRNPELVLAREPLIRSVDYAIDSITGSVFLLRSFTALDQSLNLASRYQIENGINGTDSFAAIGLVNRFPVSGALSADLGWEHGIKVSGNRGSFESAIAGFSWLPNGRFRASTRYEMRGNTGFGHILTSGGAGRISETLTTLLQFQHTRGNFLGQQSQATQASVREKEAISMQLIT